MSYFIFIIVSIRAAAAIIWSSQSNYLINSTPSTAKWICFFRLMVFVLWWTLTASLSTFGQPFLHYKSPFLTTFEISWWGILCPTIIASISTQHAYCTFAMLFSVGSHFCFAILCYLLLLETIASLHQVIYTMRRQSSMRPVLKILHWLSIYGIVHGI